MARITFKGNPLNTAGNLPKVGAKAPDFTVTKSDLSDVSLKDFSGKKVVLNIFPSIDTPVCQASTRKFNEEAGRLSNTVVVCVSRDLPFAFSRFCGTEGLKNVVATSELRNSSFGDAYGVRIAEGPLKGLFSRAVVVVDEKGNVKYTEQVPEIAQEPNYDAAINALKTDVAVIARERCLRPKQSVVQKKISDTVSRKNRLLRSARNDKFLRLTATSESPSSCRRCEPHPRG